MLYTMSQDILLSGSDIKEKKVYIIYGCGGNQDHLNKLSSKWNHLGDFCTGLYEKALCFFFYLNQWIRRRCHLYIFLFYSYSDILDPLSRTI